MENDFDPRIEPYLNGEMGPADQQAFEAELRENALLQRELRRYQQLEEAITVFGSRRVRAIGTAVRQQLGPLPVPQLSWWDRWRWGRLSSFHLAGFIAVIVMAGLLGWVNFGGLIPTTALPSRYFIEPARLGLAGQPEDGYTAERAVFERSSGYYWQTDSCGEACFIREAAALPGFDMARYYLAHWQFKNRRYDAAQAGFTDCLAESAYLQRFPETRDLDKIRFNRLLATLGASGRAASVLPELDTLLANTDAGSDVHRSARALRSELTHSLRFLLWR